MPFTLADTGTYSKYPTLTLCPLFRLLPQLVHGIFIDLNDVPIDAIAILSLTQLSYWAVELYILINKDLFAISLSGIRFR